MKKDKAKVTNEELSDEAVKRFLNERPADSTPEDFHILLKAYRGLNLENFARFIEFFKAEGRQLNTPNTMGQTLLSIINTHQASKDYCTLLINQGAE